MGHVQSYDWTAHGDVRKEGGARLSAVSENELAAVAESRLVLILLPGGRGTHAELGAALASRSAMPDKKIFIYCEDGSAFLPGEGTCAFYWAGGVRRFSGGIESVLGAIKECFG